MVQDIAGKELELDFVQGTGQHESLFSHISSDIRPAHKHRLCAQLLIPQLTASVSGLALAYNRSLSMNQQNVECRSKCFQFENGSQASLFLFPSWNRDCFGIEDDTAAACVVLLLFKVPEKWFEAWKT